MLSVTGGDVQGNFPQEDLFAFAKKKRIKEELSMTLFLPKIYKNDDGGFSTTPDSTYDIALVNLDKLAEFLARNI